jgi:acetyl-CoA synthetase
VVVAQLTMGVAEPGAGRGLSTARSVLKVLALLTEQHPDGVRVGEVATAVGKSTSTAYYLLASLVEEGFAVHDRRSGSYRLGHQGVEAMDPDATAIASVGSAVDLLFAATRKRCYLGRVGRGGIEIVALRAHQGTPRIPGLCSPIREGFHALAIGKVLLATLPLDARRRYIERGLSAYTRMTITGPEALIEDLERTAKRGYAVEQEEFCPNFCCVAAPISGGGGRLRGLLALSVTARTFEAEGGRLAAVVRDTSRKFSYLQKPAGILPSGAVGG